MIMKPLRYASALVASLVTCSIAIAAAPSAADPDGTPQLVTELTFDSAKPIGTGALPSTVLGVRNLSPAGWHYSAVRGGSLSLASTESPTLPGVSTIALEGSYPLPGAGGQYVVASYNIESLRTEDIYIEFWAKMPGAKGGCKFLKIFSDQSTAAGYANLTIGPNYSGGDYGSIYQIAFGDGSVRVNDGQHGIWLNGTHPQSIGRSYGRATILTPQNTAFSSADWGTAWHHFRVHVRFNSGTTAQNEVPDGEVYLEIDGKVYADATGLYNRNPVNGPIHNVEFFGWAQQDPQPFQVWLDGIRISTGGFLSQFPARPAIRGQRQQ